MLNHYEARGKTIELLSRDIYGPYDGKEEVLYLNEDETPLNRYITGVLYPLYKEKEIDEIASAQELDDGSIGEESSTTVDDREIGLRVTGNFAPSAFGITFSCDKSTKLIKININAGKYLPVEKNEGDGSGNVWRRSEINFPYEINLENFKTSKSVCPGLEFLILSRKPDNKGIRSVTFSLINSNISSFDLKEKCAKSFFQINFSAEGMNGEKPFLDRKPDMENITDVELKTFMMLYRQVNSYAVGHGCSADWENENNGNAGKVSSRFIPVFHLFPMLPPSDENLSKFFLKDIANLKQEQVSEFFKVLPERYENWIKEREKESLSLPPIFQEVAAQNLNLCFESAGRIRSGIELLSKDKTVFRSFILAHKAMLYQFSISDRIKSSNREAKLPTSDHEGKWFPFQIAFILQCLESLINPKSDYRDVTDLLWFPTGGGKTEAYLGITALLLFYRRLIHKGNGQGGGVTVITRYTLRLLTIDQFYRSASLICSCEKVRRNENDLKQTYPLSIGLWVGGGASPNTISEAETALKKLKENGQLDTESDPCKLTECPWCGEEINIADYKIRRNPYKMEIFCRNPLCDFHAGLPVWITDEDIYRERPSLVIGTVDKFARLPWLEDAGNLFSTDGLFLPPELIIQDELHLISGPLGTMVGLYETAVEILCQNNGGNAPKIIASTATIRNASSQIKSLFGKNFRQFPQPCIDYSDSFFAKEDRKARSRAYAGVYTSGFSNTTTVVRTYSNLLYAPQTYEADDYVKDTYWTLIGYFNSLRELGGTSVLVSDDVHDYLEFMFDRDKGRFLPRNLDQETFELTSRVSNQELINYRDNMWKSYPDTESPDVVLATNMISVGLDVPRLGLMIISGQPKTTAEYIQASSRVGRKYPGLVITIYNISHSRDRSHYEKFKTYHSKVYGEVEATSVTPYSIRSLERGLHAVFITLIRHLIPSMKLNSAAAKFSTSLESLDEIKEMIIKRIRYVDEKEEGAAQQLLDDIINKWSFLTESYNELYYYKSDANSILSAAEDRNQEIFPTMNSLRNIDRSAKLKKPN